MRWNGQFRCRTLRTLSIRLLLAVSATGFAEQRGGPAPPGPATPAAAAARIVTAAQAVLATLDDAGRAKVQFPFEGPQKARWSNLPTGIFEREGLRMGDLTPAQRTAVTTLLTAARPVVVEDAGAAAVVEA